MRRGCGGKPEKKQITWKTQKQMWDSIKMHIKEIGQEIVDWIDLALGRGQWWTLANTAVNLGVT